MRNDTEQEERAGHVGHTQEMTWEREGRGPPVLLREVLRASGTAMATADKPSPFGLKACRWATLCLGRLRWHMGWAQRQEGMGKQG